MSELLYLDGLPQDMRNGGVLKLLIEIGGVDKHRIGKIVVRDGLATVEVDNLTARAVRKLDGAKVDLRHVRAWQQPNRHNVDDHFLQLLHWLDLEAKAEQEQLSSSQAQTESQLSRLVIKEESVGLGGTILLRFAPRNEQAALPWTALSAGSPVTFHEEGQTEAPRWRGVVTNKRRRFIEIGVSRTPEPVADRPTFAINLANDEISRRRMQRALSQVMAASGNRLAELRDILRGHNPAVFAPCPAIDDDLMAGLNGDQKTAVSHALAAEDIAIIHGPPGTGKTTALVALIQAAVRSSERVLACAPSNMAVDNLCAGLVAAGVRIVRLGHPARIQSQLQAHTLDALVAKHDDYRLAQKMRRDGFALRDKVNKWQRARPEPGAKQAYRAEADELLATARQLEAQAVERVLDNAQVLLATLTGIDSAQIGQRQFDLCVIDEAGQSTEPATWIPVTRSQRLVLAGDHQQLPPTILSHTAAKAGYDKSLLEQLMLREQTNLSHQLTVQYRMHTDIMGFSSAEFYGDTLVADAAVAHHLLRDLPGVDLEGAAVTFIDTAGAGYDEELEPDSNSRRNPQEAALVVAQVNKLREAGVGDIGIITPYAAQVRLLRDQLPDDIEINSVDGFQGREKEAIIISLVRSNNRGEVGFLAETRRINVALTRARRKLLVIGDSATITAHDFYGRLIDYWDTIGAYQSVWELGD